MNALILSLLMANSAPNAIPAKHLATAIIQTAKKYHQDPLLVTQIVLIESNANGDAYNPITQDFGVMQINIKTAAAMHLDTACLLDWRCNLDKGVLILSKLNRVCRYNVGTGPLIGKRFKNCLTYESRLATIK